MHNKNHKNIHPEHSEHKEDANGALGEVLLAKSEYEALVKKSQERDEYHNKMLKAMADFDNFKKRLEKDKIEYVKFANEGLILEFLGILDNFERGIKFAEQKKDFDLMHQGVEMIIKQLYGILGEKGLKKIESNGKKFDPYLHEVLETVEGTQENEGNIVEELQPGYELNGKVIRPAKVKVVKVKSDLNIEENKED